MGTMSSIPLSKTKKLIAVMMPKIANIIQIEFSNQILHKAAQMIVLFFLRANICRQETTTQAQMPNNIDKLIVLVKESVKFEEQKLIVSVTALHEWMVPNKLSNIHPSLAKRKRIRRYGSGVYQWGRQIMAHHKRNHHANHWSQSLHKLWRITTKWWSHDTGIHRFVNI